MSFDPTKDEPSADDTGEDVARVLRSAGARRAPPPGMRERVHADALAAFERLPAPSHAVRSAVSGRAQSGLAQSIWAHHRKAYAIAAGMLLAVLAGLLWQQREQPGVQPVLAYVNYSRGSWQMGGHRAPSNMPITGGAQLNTSADAALELQLIGGALVRVDSGTQLTLAPNNRIELHQGRVFIEVHGRAQSVHVLTPQGEITDIGTEFEVQVAPSEVTVRVREGQVRLHNDHTELTAGARAGIGDALRIDTQGHVHRSHIDTADRYWDWLAGARPAYALDRGSLHDFLHWSASAAGLSLRYQSETVRQAAVATHTRGNIDGMQLTTAIDNVLATTRLQRMPAARYELLIDFANER